MSAVTHARGGPAGVNLGAENLGVEGVSSEYLLANGVRFHLARVSTSESEARGRKLVLFLHGFPEFWYSWRHQLRHFGALSGLDCVAPDLRGYNLTEKPEGGYDVDTLADDQAALIAELGYEDALVVGHDWGAAVAWHLAQRHPKVVRRLAILNCPPVDVLRRHLLTNLEQLRRSHYIFLFQIPGVERKLAAKEANLVRRALRSSAAPSTRELAFSPEDLDRYAEAALRPGALTAALAYYRTVLRDAVLPWRWRRLTAVSPISAPTLVLWGKDDPALGVELTHGLEARCLGGLTLQYLDDCGHFIQQERPEVVNASLERFLLG